MGQPYTVINDLLEIYKALINHEYLLICVELVMTKIILSIYANISIMGKLLTKPPFPKFLYSI